MDVGIGHPGAIDDQRMIEQRSVAILRRLHLLEEVREQRDVELVLGQGMLKAGWNAHKLNAPGKFLVSAPEHEIPRRARAYLVTDQMVTETAARHAQIPRQLDEISRNAVHTMSATGFRSQYGNSGQSPVETLWNALHTAPGEGWEIGDLMNITGMTRPTLYRHLRDLVSQGRAYQVSRGRWRARTPEGGHGE